MQGFARKLQFVSGVGIKKLLPHAGLDDSMIPAIQKPVKSHPAPSENLAVLLTLFMERYAALPCNWMNPVDAHEQSSALC